MDSKKWFFAGLWFAYLLFEMTLEFSWLSGSYPDDPFLKRFWLAFQGEFYQFPLKIPFVLLLLRASRVVPKNVTERFIAVLKMVFITISAIVLYRLMIAYVLAPVLYGETVSLADTFKANRLISSILDIITLGGAAIGIDQYLLRAAQVKRSIELEAEKMNAELKFLRAQIHPHFLFNTLNNIYGLARKKSDVAAESILRLSGLLRFMLYESGRETIPLRREIELLSDYIELERLRYGDALLFSFDKEIDELEAPIAPLILLPLVENAFKHGAGESVSQPWITILLDLKDGTLRFTVHNSRELAEDHAPSGKIGLANLRRQLSLLYPDHVLSFEETDKTFSATLLINLNHHARTLVSDH